MDVKEYQAKKFFQQYSIPVLDSQVIDTAEKAIQATQKIGGKSFVLKAQVLAGGRGKAGGVLVVKTPEEVQKVANKLLHSHLVTAQTSKKGEWVSHVLIEKAVSIKRECYLALLLDPSSSQVLFMASLEGGVDIEELSTKTPEKILKLKIPPHIGFSLWNAWEIGKFLGFSKKEDIQFLFKMGQQLYKLFIEKDASLIEINPLAQTQKGDWIALDGKMSFDENSFYRQADLKKIHEEQNRNQSEDLALKHGLSFIQLEGEIGCMVNGAGLAMATMDIIQLYGGRPANFLDVGGGAEEGKVKKAFEIILQDKNIKSILVNIFGGIMRCDVIASALIKALEEVNVSIPLVIRLEGTRSKEGMEKISKSSLQLIVAEDLDSAAKKAVQLSNTEG